MKRRHLKTLRVCIAIAFFVPISLLFLDFRDTGIRSLAEALLFLQVVPSALKFLNDAAFAAAGCFVILGITLLFGRVYCAAICPLGTFQDLVSRLFSKRGKSRGKRPIRYRYTDSPPHSILRYTVLCLTILLFVPGSGLMLTLLDPFSSFGRILSNMFRPVVIALNNWGVPLAEALGSHAIFRVQWPVFTPVSLSVAGITFSTVAWLSARNGRLYCNTLCPVGTLLGLVSKVSLFRIGMDPAACRSCDLCRSVCKAGCIDVRNHTVDTSRCVSCFNCLAVCPDQAMTFQAKWQRRRQRIPKPGRRNFMLALAAGSVGLAAGRAEAAPVPPPVHARPTTIPEEKTCPISPPGSASINRYGSICTACHLCVSACPSRVLVPAVFAFGLSGIMQPQMDFHAGHCNYDCTVCSHICPTGAIRPLTTEEKQRTQTGVAKFIQKNCVVFTDNTNCGACSEHCPTKAVHMVPYLNAAGRKLVIPNVNESLCVGCGGCEHACPTTPFKAIYVDGNLVHKTAQKPVEDALEKNEDADEKLFPF